MKFSKLKLGLSEIVLLAFVIMAFAGVSSAQLMPLPGPSDISELKRQSINGTGFSIENGVPSANVPNSQNTNDLNLKQNDDGNVVSNSNKLGVVSSSIVENYFKILTGDKLGVYGSREFGQGQDSSLLFFNTFGRGYRLAPGDVLRVNLRGFVEVNSSFKVTRDGKLILPSLPPIDVIGITTEELEQKILILLKLGDASASVFVSLDTARLVPVQISGGVMSPRTVAVPAYTPLSRVLAYVGGVSDAGSLRNITLISNDGVINKIDFYDFLQNPLGGVDPVISDGARIFVGDLGETVAVSGFVSKPGIYELASGVKRISAKTLMRLSATNLLPPGAVVEVLYFDSNGVPRSRSIKFDEEINSGEALNVRFINTRNTNSISVRGAIIKPYELTTTKSQPLRKLLKGGAVFSRDAELSLAIVHGPNIKPYIIDINEALSSNQSMTKTSVESLELDIQPNSTIYILSKSEYKNLIESNGTRLKKVKFDKNTAVNKVNKIDTEQQINFDLEINREQPTDIDQEAAIASLLIAKKVNIYLDGKLNVVLAPNTKALGEPKLTALATGFDVYPLYVGFNRYNEKTRAWNYLQLKISGVHVTYLAQWTDLAHTLSQAKLLFLKF